jgi:hypothetical protein
MLWPKTKLIVGIRHPVWYFQSLYNFRVQNLDETATMPHPNQLIGRCVAGMYHVCTEKANFAKYLLRLGKQPKRQQPTALQQSIVNHYPHASYNITAVPHVPNPVFLFDVQQLHRATPTFARDVQMFVNVTTALPKLVEHARPGMTYDDADVQLHKDKLKIHICHDEYRPLRTELMRLSRQTSEWLRAEFLHAPDVFVSSRLHLHEILLKWMDDPCETDGVNATEFL